MKQKNISSKTFLFSTLFCITFFMTIKYKHILANKNSWIINDSGDQIKLITIFNLWLISKKLLYHSLEQQEKTKLYLKKVIWYLMNTFIYYISIFYNCLFYTQQNWYLLSISLTDKSIFYNIESITEFNLFSSFYWLTKIFAIFSIVACISFWSIIYNNIFMLFILVVRPLDYYSLSNILWT